jgi:SAM-dependent methyltransferase
VSARKPLWKRLARNGFFAALRVGSLFEARFSRTTGAPLPPVDLRYYYYRTWKRAAFWRACEAARVEVLSHGLQPHHRVLDIGSGIGNLALGLKDYLEAGYDGLEIHPRAVAWCQEAITPRYPALRFHRAAVQSDAYNPQGRTPAATYRFPFADRAFDFVFLGSVFTHLLPDAVENYLREIARVLRPGGTLAASFFLLNDDSRRSVLAGRSFMSFAIDHASGLCRLHDASVPEAAVAIEEAFVARVLRENGLQVQRIRRGGWAQGVADDQDVVTAQSRIPHL